MSPLCECRFFIITLPPSPQRSNTRYPSTHQGGGLTMAFRQIALLAALLVAAPALAQGRWSQMKPIPQGEEEVVGVAVDGRMYVLGGLGAFPGWGRKQIFFRYDPAANEWSKLPSLPEGVHHPGVAAVGSKIYVMGGFTISRPAGGGLPAWVPTSSVWVFDIPSNAWSKGVAVPTPRGALTATAVGTRIYAIGGAKNPRYSTPRRATGRRCGRCSPRATTTAPP